MPNCLSELWVWCNNLQLLRTFAVYQALDTYYLIFFFLTGDLWSTRRKVCYCYYYCFHFTGGESQFQRSCRFLQYHTLCISSFKLLFQQSWLVDGAHDMNTCTRTSSPFPDLLLHYTVWCFLKKLISLSLYHR